MKIHWRVLRTAVVASALFGLLFAAFYARAGHPKGPDFPPQGSTGSFGSDYMSTHQRELDAKLRVFMAEYRCTTAESWRRTHPATWDLPKLMVLKKNLTWQLMVAAWDYPAPPGFWTMLLCEGSK